jgi:enolase
MPLASKTMSAVSEPTAPSTIGFHRAGIRNAMTTPAAHRMKNAANSWAIMLMLAPQFALARRMSASTVAFSRRRYRGKGVLTAASNVQMLIQPHLKGSDASDQLTIDQSLIELDGSPDKSRLGANAILGVSMAVARAAAAASGVPLYRHLGGPTARRLPVPMLNVINGGRHAENSLDFQEFMIVPHGAPTFSEALRYGAETFYALSAGLRKRGYSTAVGDEGGFAPNLKSADEACELIIEAIRAAGLTPNRDIAMALDPAATSFWTNGRYALEKSNGGSTSRERLLELYASLVSAYPIISIEDGFAEDDWEGCHAWRSDSDRWRRSLRNQPILIRRGVEERATNSALIKPNQIGTISETIKAIDICRQAGWRYVISHRSGETEDTFIADFAAAMDGGQIKAGSLSRSERLAKYNRLIEIERELGPSALYVNPFRNPRKPALAHTDVNGHTSRRRTN